MSRTRKFTGVAIFLTLTGMTTQAVCLAFEWDPEATKELHDHVRPLLAKPRAEHKLDPETANRYVGIVQRAEKENSERVIVAVIGLAFSKDEESLALLGRVSTSDNHPGGVAARYALLVREVSSLPDDQALAVLSFHLGRSNDDLEKRLLANRIAVDFRKTGARVILAATREEVHRKTRPEMSKSPTERERALAGLMDEFDRRTRWQMLYYLLRADLREVDKEVLTWDWKDKGFSICMSGDRGELMYGLTPDMPREHLDLTIGDMLDEMRKRTIKE